MSDTPRNYRPGSTRIAIIVLLVLAVVGLGATVVWQNYGPGAEPSRTASVQPAVQSQAPPRDEPYDETKQALNALQQAVKDLQDSQQQTADHLSETKRELAAELGERKMLSEQVGSLAGRVDGLAASGSSVAAGSTGTTSSKKKR
jgi:flagellar basal body-associated protein FliL